jgi:hypothetical protein
VRPRGRDAPQKDVTPAVVLDEWAVVRPSGAIRGASLADLEREALAGLTDLSAESVRVRFDRTAHPV